MIVPALLLTDVWQGDVNQLLTWLLLLGGSSWHMLSWRSLTDTLFVCLCSTERGARFLNRHAEGLQQIWILLPEEMNTVEWDSGSKALLHFYLLFFYVVCWNVTFVCGVKVAWCELLIEVVACCWLRHDVHDQPPSWMCWCESILFHCTVIYLWIRMIIYIYD